jgi:gamma-glutamyl:cysteine ligase YbdK (ATP-grasp superfamily)
MLAQDREPVRRSIEVEYWVIDEEGHLVEPSEDMVAGSGAEREFVEPILEIKTTPCETTEKLRVELFERVGEALERAATDDKRLVPLATPLNEDRIRELENDRTRIQNQVVGGDFSYVRHCAGTHIHVEQVPGHEADQVNALVALDPALALVNSSPYYQGRHLAAGARSKLYRWMAYDDVPHQGWLWPYIDDTDEWKRRLERRYDEFVIAAADAGINRRTVEFNFEPESAIWTPVQLREEFPTVEWRSPDTSLPSQVVRLADQIATVATHATETTLRIEGDEGRVTENGVVVPTFDAILGYVNAAIRDGLASTSVRSYLERMGFDVDAYLPVSHEIEDRAPLSQEDARRLRVEYAERLEHDVQRADAVHSR